MTTLECYPHDGPSQSRVPIKPGSLLYRRSTGRHEDSKYVSFITIVSIVPIPPGMVSFRLVVLDEVGLCTHDEVASDWFTWLDPYRLVC